MLYPSQIESAQGLVKRTAMMKVLRETVGTVYYKVAIRENADLVDSSDDLKDYAEDTMKNELEGLSSEELVEYVCTNQNLTGYLAEAIALAESIGEKKAEEITEESDYPHEIDVELDEEDRRVISEFNELKADDYADEVHARVGEVLATESELARVKEAQTEELVANIKNVDSTEESDMAVVNMEEEAEAETSLEFFDKVDAPEPTEEEESGEENIYETALNTMSVLPDTLFQSIVTRAGKSVLKESAGDDSNLLEHTDSIVGEAILEYALHETFNALGLIKYDRERLSRLKHDYFMG